MKNFVSFLLKKVYNFIPIDENVIDKAFVKTCDDVRYHFPKLSKEEIELKIKRNSNELAIFLFRVGRELHKTSLENLKPQIHWLLKELCSCEIYFNNKIDKGFYIVHGEGTVIGSRNEIGKGFIIHQGCTIGHKINGEGEGNKIGNNVTMYCNSSIIGELKISDSVIIGAHVMVTSDVDKKILVTNKNRLKAHMLSIE